MVLSSYWRHLVLILAVMAGSEIEVRTVSAAAVYWNTPTSGDWNAAANWSNGVVPTGADDVTIDQPGSLQVSINSASSAKSLNSQTDVVLGSQLTLASDSVIHGIVSTGTFLSGSTILNGGGNLSIEGALVWNAGSMQGAGKTSLSADSISTIAPSAVFTSNPAPMLSRTFENAGVVNYLPSSATWLSFNGGTFKNLSTGTFNAIPSVNNALVSMGGLNSFDNAGTFNKYGSSSQSLNMPLTNSGTVNIYDGTLALSSGGNLGTINMTLGAALTISSSFTNSGTINIQDYDNSSSGSTAFSASALDNASSGHLNVLKGDVALPGMTNSGEIHIAAGASATISGSFNARAGSKFTGPGSLTFNSSVSNFAGSIESVGDLLIASSVTFTADQSIAANLHLTGTLGGTGNISIAGPFTWTMGTMTGAGKTTIAAGAVATLGYAPPFSSSGSIILNRLLENAGTINLLRNGSGGATLGFSTGTLNNLAQGTLNISCENSTSNFGGAGTLNNAGVINVAVSLNANPFNLGNVVLNNTGVINVNSGGLTGFINNSGVMNVFAGSAMPAVNSGTVNLYTGGSSRGGTNTGTLRVLGGTLALSDAQGLGGEINVLPGATATIDGGNGILASTTVKITGAGSVSLSNFSNQLFPFAGLLQTSGTVAVNNTVNISTDQTLPGRLAVGPNFSSTTLTGAGNLFVANGLDWTTGTLSGSGKLILGPQSSSTFSAAGTKTLSTQLENAGALTFSPFTSGTYIFANGTLTNAATGVITVPDSTSITFSQSGGTNAFNNAGILKFVNHPSMNVTIPMNNTGTIDIQRGNLQMSGLASYTQTAGHLILAGGSFFGSAFTLQGGSIEGFGIVGASVISHGTIAPGGPTGSLSMGTLTLMSDAKTMFDLGGRGKGVLYDSISASANSVLGGTLLVSFVNGFESSIASTDVFTLLTTSNALTGAFQNAGNGQRFLTADGLGSFIAHYGAGSTFDPKFVVLSDFVPFVPGDFNADGITDGADFVAWQTHFPLSTGGTLATGDADGDGDVDGADFVAWQTGGSAAVANVAVPEPTARCLALLMVAGVAAARGLLCPAGRKRRLFS